MNWTVAADYQKFQADTANLNQPYNGSSMMVMGFRNIQGKLPNPVVFGEQENATAPLDGDHMHEIQLKGHYFEDFLSDDDKIRFQAYLSLMPDFQRLNNLRPAGDAVQENETSHVAMSFRGTHRLRLNDRCQEVAGGGHHGVDYVGAASVRSGKGFRMGHVTPSLVQSVGCV